jgi:hypothetical protein
MHGSSRPHRKSRSTQTWRLVPLVIAWIAAGCSVSKVPEGIECRATLHGGSTSSSLTEALTRATAGDCVVVTGSYEGSFEVPVGVKLVAEPGTAPELKGERSDAPALRLLGGEGALLQGISITSAPGTGILLDGDAVDVVDVSVRASKFGLVAYCAGSGCLGKFYLKRLQLIQNDVGLWASGVQVRLEGGRIAENGISGSLQSGMGVAAQNGARLEMVETIVEKNDYGVVIDGGAGTSAKLTDVQVLSSVERGVWMQHLRGTRTAPSVTIEGDKTTIDANALTGVGATDSQGIAITGGRISNTRARLIVTSTGEVSVGDGLGLFSGTGEVRVDGVRMESNERCQLLIDRGAAGIDLLSIDVAQGTGKYGAVVQNTSPDVNGGEGFRTTDGSPLPVSDPSLGVPKPAQ